jgi:Zn-dependent peptidase ImmA (M78 family)/transcriptional regulator with XRE-family HTH domain
VKGRDDSPPIGPNDVHLAAHRFNAARLTLARELRAITRADLAERVSKTPSAISQFEVGRSRPDARTLAAIALVLGVPVGFFARTAAAPPISVDACHFRTLRSASQRDRRRLISIGTLLCELVDSLEEHVEFPAEQVTSVSRAVHSAEDIELCANDVRKRWGLGLGPIPNITKLLQSQGVLVCLVPNTCREVDAFSAWYQERPLIFLVTEHGAARTRFDAAHELGHLVMHADAAPGSQEIEREAHRFAGAFLVPREPFLTECPRWLNWGHFHELKTRWKMSLAALIRRAYDLGALSEASFRRACIQLRQQGPEEPFEPPPEPPDFLMKAVKLLEGDVSLEQLAAAQGLSAADVRALVEGVPLQPCVSDARCRRDTAGALQGRRHSFVESVSHRGPVKERSDVADG